MQIEMHAVDAEIRRPDPAHDGIEVRPVAVKIAPPVVDRLRLLKDLIFKQTAGIGIGQHEGSDIVIQGILQLGQVDPSPFVERNAFDDIAAGGSRGRVGSVRGIRDQDATTGIPAGFQCRTDGHQSAKFPMGASRR